MKNLTNLGVQELSIKEQKEVNGGYLHVYWSGGHKYEEWYRPGQHSPYRQNIDGVRQRHIVTYQR